jgi:hypothetical protein
MLRQLSLTGQILNAFCSAAKPPSSARYGGVPFTSDKSSYQSQSARPSDLVGVIPVQPISVHQSGGLQCRLNIDLIIFDHLRLWWGRKKQVASA